MERNNSCIATNEDLDYDPKQTTDKVSPEKWTAGAEEVEFDEDFLYDTRVRHHRVELGPQSDHSLQFMPILRSSSPDDARRAISHIMQRNDSYAGQSHTKSPVTNRAPVTDDTALLTVSPPSKPRRPSWPPQVVHADGGTHSRQLVRPYTVPSFAGDTPGPSSSTAAQQNTIGNTHSKCLGSYDPSVNQVNESRETYPLPPDFATSLSSDGRRRMEGVSLPASIVPLHY